MVDYVALIGLSKIEIKKLSTITHFLTMNMKEKQLKWQGVHSTS